MHALVLDRPPAECAERACARTSHEGGLLGPPALAVVSRMATELEAVGGPPTAAGGPEGFVSVTTITSDAEAAAAVEAWSEGGGEPRKGVKRRRVPGPALGPAPPLRPRRRR